ncbi:MAG: MASE1 domain-containing protein, partial [Rhodospirillales bacterium]
MPNRTYRLAVYVGLTVAVVIGVTVLVTPHFMFPPDGISVFWPTNGIVLGLLLILPAWSRRWTCLALLPAYYVAELLIGHPPVSSVGFVFANSAEIILALLILDRLGLAAEPFSGLRSLLYLLATLVVCSVTGGLMGTLTVAMTSEFHPVVYYRWSVADLVGHMMFLPRS